MVLVQVGQPGEGRFEPREVKLGPRDREFVAVLSGVKEGEPVVVAANFLLDADVAAQNANFIQYASPVEAAKPKIKPELLQNPVIYPSAETMKRLSYLEDLGKDTRMWDAAWTAVKSQ